MYERICGALGGTPEERDAGGWAAAACLQPPSPPSPSGGLLPCLWLWDEYCTHVNLLNPQYE